MQKVINVLAIASTVVSAAVVGSGLYVYVNRASIIDGIKSQALEFRQHLRKVMVL